MELEKVTAEIRPRTQWEAIDLGVSLVRAHASALLKGWMASVYPLCLLILVLSWNSMGWGLFLIWWLKPVWERVALHPLSRSLFGEHPTWRETMKVLPAELLKNKGLVIMGVVLTLTGALISSIDDRISGAGFTVLFWLTTIGLLFYRSGLSRSLVLPVKYLEGLSGARYKSRVQILSYRSSSSAVGLTFICLLMEFLLMLSQVLFVAFMIPEGIDLEQFSFYYAFTEGETGLLPKWIYLVLALFYLNAMSVVAWFYTGGGFGLYVNTRTWTEGWDIELKFKGLGQRLGIMVLALGLFGSSPSLEADEVVNQEAQQVLEGEEFKVETREVFAPKEKKDKKKDSTSDSDSSRSYDHGAGVFAGIGHLLFYAILAVAIGGLVWIIVANAHLFRKGGPGEEAHDSKKVTTVAGMNVEPENLPPNLLQVARSLWDEGRYQEALGLLYRGAISSLVTDRLVEIEESDTEMDCLRRVTSKGEQANASYFQLLTGAWMSQAYAQRLPDEETLEQLWQKWPYPERRGA
jgi:hypothetical protein